MARDRPTRDPGTREGSVELSTGQTVHLPLEVEATMLGAVYAAPRDLVAEFLPAGVRPVRATAGGQAAVTLLSVEYHRIGVPGIEPYDEFSVLFPAVHGSTRTVPYLSALTRATSGYVWYLPVTTEPAKALGVDVWGYPKVVGDVDHEDAGSRRRTTLSVDGERVLSLSVDRPPAVDRREDGYSYTVHDGDRCRVPIDVDGRVGGWPFTDRVAVTLGDHPRAARLADLGLGGRALARIGVEGTARFHRAEVLGPVDE